MVAMDGKIEDKLEVISFPEFWLISPILAEWLVGLRSVRYEKYCDFRFWLRPKYLSFGRSIADVLEVK